MDDGREGIDRVAVEEDIHLDQVRLLLAGLLVVERGVALGAGFQHVEEVEDDFTQWHGVAQLHAVFGQVIHPAHLATLGLAELHGRADELLGHDDGHGDNGLVDLVELAFRPVRGVVNPAFLAVFCHHAVGHGRGGRNQVEAELALQAVAGDFHVQQAQEAAAEAKAKGDGGLGLEGQGGIVKLQLF